MITVEKRHEVKSSIPPWMSLSLCPGCPRVPEGAQLVAIKIGRLCYIAFRFL